MNPVYEAQSMFHDDDIDEDSDNDSDYIDFDNESVMDEEMIPFISIRIDDLESLIHIRVRPKCLTKESLGRSILQVIKASTSSMDNSTKLKKIMKYNCFSENAPIEGMFREIDSLFIPLDDILHSTSEYNETIFRLQPPSPSPITPESLSISNDINLLEESELTNSIRTFFHKHGIFVIACLIPLTPRFFLLVCTDCLWDYVAMIWKILFYIPLWLDEVFVITPLQQIYRNGPTRIGWRGASLSYICAQLSPHDESFWLENMDICEQKYERKLNSFVFFLKPLIYIFFFVGAYLTMKVFKKKGSIDSDMAATYDAFQILVKQMVKAVKK